MNQTYQQQENLTDEPIGGYGEKWMKFMEEHHKGKVRKMKAAGTYCDVARSVDKDAWNYRELLDCQYAELHPRPHTFEEIVTWERTRAFYTDSAVMRERVLIAVTEP